MGIFSSMFGPTKKQRKLADEQAEALRQRLAHQVEMDRRWKLSREDARRQDALAAEKRRKANSDVAAAPTDWSVNPYPSSIHDFSPNHHTPAVSGHGGTFDGGGASSDWSSSSSSSSDCGSSSDSGSSCGSSD